MEDNGLLQYYRDKYNVKDGFVRAEDLIRAKKISDGFRIKGYFKTKIKGQDYYLKMSHFYKEVDAEVILGQVYKKAGIESAIYTPAKVHMPANPEKHAVISNDVVKSNGVVFKDFINNHYLDGLKWSKLFGKKMQDITPRFFEKQTLKDVVLMHALDMASFNTDRNPRNFGFYVKGEKATGLFTYDNGIAFDVINHFSISPEKFCGEREDVPEFYNYLDFCKNTNSRLNIINEIKENENIAKVISPQEIAETVGNINIPKIAEDIKDTIGFEVDKHCVEVLDASFTNMTEELSK